ncbi:restriction endonuclease subunit S [Oceanisphaera sp. W20_SRM_FM3]|uniref:restriction endonuclease subunit S n=1 Tax=Oceanisphaera sp. W20_SRM_FM3 TaxID=3240267 RepID=UPI003F960057
MEWKISNLTDISQVQTGKWDANHATEDGAYKFFTCAYEAFLCDTKRFDGECLILPGNGANVGEVFYYSGEFDAYQRTYIVSNIKIFPKFLFYHMKCFWRERNLDKQYGSATNYLKIGNFKEYEVSYPCILEQKRIVAILDEAFADIEQARAKTEQNLKNARELFESYLQQVFSLRGEGWVETNLGTVAAFKNGLNFSQSSKGEKLKVVGVKDFKSNFMVPFEQLDTIQIDGDLSEAYELKENDIITVRSNGNKRLIGRCLLVGEVGEKTSYSGFTIRIRLESKDVFPKFLAYYLKSSTVHELLINSGGGANISNLNQKILTSLPVAFPHFDKQMQLVDAIEKVEIESQALERVYANKLNTIDELKQSILQKAFSGELSKKESKGAVA